MAANFLIHLFSILLNGSLFLVLKHISMCMYICGDWWNSIPKTGEDKLNKRKDIDQTLKLTKTVISKPRMYQSLDSVYWNERILHKMLNLKKWKLVKSCVTIDPKGKSALKLTSNGPTSRFTIHNTIQYNTIRFTIHNTIRFTICTQWAVSMSRHQRDTCTPSIRRPQKCIL